MKKIKIILVDDSDAFRDALRLLINRIKDFEVIAEASNGKEFLNLLMKHKVDIVLMDIFMPVMDGIEATKKSLEINPDLKIIALSMSGDWEYDDKILKAGASGIVRKNFVNEDIEKVIRMTLKNKTL